MAETVLGKMSIVIAANTAEMAKSLSKAEGQFSGFTKKIQNIGATIGIAFGVQQVASFAFEVSKLAGEAEGVGAAFNKLPDATRLINDLKTATGSTVSELELMKTTVQASNFGIGLQQLPELLKFAAIRAQQTGQSVEYLVQSIITGIGRKSPLILDNLGISAVRLKEKFGGAALEAQSIADVTKAVGAIATEELSKMGEFSDNASSRVQKLNATWENFKVTLGQSQFTSGITGFTDDLLSLFTVILGGKPRVEDLKFQLEASVDAFNELENGTVASVAAFTSATQAADLLGVKLIKVKDEATGLTKLLIDPRTKIQVIKPEDAQAQITTLESLQSKLKQLNDDFASTNSVDKQKLSNIGNEIQKTQELIAELEKYRKKEKEKNDEKRRSVNLESLAVQGLTKTAQAFIKIQDEAARASEEIGKFINAMNPVITLPDKITIPDSLRKSIDEIKATMQQAGSEIGQIGIDIGNSVAGAISGIAEDIGTALGSGDFKNLGKALLVAVANFAQQLGAIMISIGVGRQLLNSGNPYAMIAGGAILVAAGAALKAALGKQKELSGISLSGGGGSGRGSSGGGSSSFSGIAQNSEPIKVEVEGVLRGQDIWLMGKNYESNGRYTKTVNG